MRCAYAPLGQEGTRVFVWAVCGEHLVARGQLFDGSGMSMPAAFEIATDSGRARVVGVEVPEMGNRYAPSIRRIFPESTWPQIFDAHDRYRQRGMALGNYLRTQAAARLGLPPSGSAPPGTICHPFRAGPSTVGPSHSYAGDTMSWTIRRTRNLSGVSFPACPRCEVRWARSVSNCPCQGKSRAAVVARRVGTSPIPHRTPRNHIVLTPSWECQTARPRVAYIRECFPYRPVNRMTQETCGGDSGPRLRSNLGIPVPFLVNARWAGTRSLVARDSCLWSRRTPGASYVVSGETSGGRNVTLSRREAEIVPVNPR